MTAVHRSLTGYPMPVVSSAPRFRRLALSSLALLCSALAACSESGGSDPTPDYDPTALLADVPTKVILATHVDFEARVDALGDAVAALDAGPTDGTLDAARDAWRAARRPWEQSEGFLFGPVTQGIDPSLDSWPVNQADLDAVLAGSATLTVTYVNGLEGTLKGFHTIEYLLFGTDGEKTAGDLTAREREYLVAVTGSLAASVTQLREAWDPAAGDYAAVVATAGASGNSVYTSQSQALQELVNGMIGICDEVGNGKISDPFDQQDRSLEESQFSDNSNVDFADNIRSVQNLYLGRYGASAGTGFRDLVLARAPDLDARLQGEIEAAITAIGAMTPSFGEAITGNPAAVEAARAAVRTLRQTLESELLPLATQ
jgi:putative iron-regulated protein